MTVVSELGRPLDLSSAAAVSNCPPPDAAQLRLTELTSGCSSRQVRRLRFAERAAVATAPADGGGQPAGSSCRAGRYARPTRG